MWGSFRKRLATDYVEISPPNSLFEQHSLPHLTTMLTSFPRGTMILTISFPSV